MLAAAILALLALAAGLALRLHPTEPGRRPGDAAQIARLPARPADIEAHGGPELSTLPPDVSRRANDAVPFAPGLVIAARPFRFRGSAQDRARAQKCLAAAELYEAGSDAEGQAAVAQVVLNRARHPAFPGTICGVVYQGATRTTGCQFTFTCDGSLARVIPEPFWQRARTAADRALSGSVFRAVGLATHYHTQEVYPWWSPSLTKLARVGPHLFFRWPGTWGSPAAFARGYSGGEPDPAALVRAPGLTPAPASEAPPEAAASDQDTFANRGGLANRGSYAKRDLPLPEGVAAGVLHGARLRLVHPDGGFFGLLVTPAIKPLQLCEAARTLCKAHGGPGGWCRVMAWGHETDIPAGFPVPPAARGRLVFDYVQDSEAGEPHAAYDCQYFPTAHESCR